MPRRVNIDFDKYVLYVDTVRDYPVAIDFDEHRRIQSLSAAWQSIESIPEEEFVEGIILHLNDSTQGYEIMNPVKISFKVVDMKEAATTNSWDDFSRSTPLS